MRGYISITYTVWCGRCGKWEYVDDPHRKPTKNAHKAGWKYTKQDGWICPACKKTAEH